MVLLFSQNGNFRVAMEKVIECCSGNAELSRGLRAGNAVGKHLANVFAAVVKASFLIVRAESAAERYACGFFAVQRIGRDDGLHAFAHVQGKVEALKNIHGLLVWPRRIIFFGGRIGAFDTDCGCQNRNGTRLFGNERCERNPEAEPVVPAG